MSALPPRTFPETPWTADAMGIVRSSDGRILGTAHFGEMGRVAEMQMIARLFAASGYLAVALRRLRKAQIAFDAASKSELTDDEIYTAALSELETAEARADEALAALKDPRLDPILNSWRVRVPGQDVPEMVRP